jgi:hypothetical protein
MGKTSNAELENVNGQTTITIRLLRFFAADRHGKCDMGRTLTDHFQMEQLVDYCLLRYKAIRVQKYNRCTVMNQPMPHLEHQLDSSTPHGLTCRKSFQPRLKELSRMAAT